MNSSFEHITKSLKIPFNTDERAIANDVQDARILQNEINLAF